MEAGTKGGRREAVSGEQQGEPITAPPNTVTDFTSDPREKRMTKEATEERLEALFMQIREERGENKKKLG